MTPGAWSFGRGERAERVDVRSRFSANSGDVLAEAAARGLGIAQLPDFIAEPYLRDGRLEEILEEFAPGELGVYALLPGARHLPYRVRVLIEFLSARLSSEPSGLVQQSPHGTGSRP
jgi:DNA-binding transcriptional LysR family regulator